MYTDTDSDLTNDTGVVYIWWQKPPGYNDQLICQVKTYSPGESTLYKTADNAGIDLSNTISSDTFYYFRISFNYDSNQIIWSVNGKQGWRSETWNTSNLAGQLGNITKIAIGAGFSYYSKHWMDSLSWTWAEGYEGGDLMNFLGTTPPSLNLLDYWYYFVIGFVGLGGIITASIVLVKRNQKRTFTPKSTLSLGTLKLSNCPYCGGILPQDAIFPKNFCPFCGKDLPKG